VGAPGLNPANMPELVWDLAITKAHLGDEDGAMTDAMTFGQYDATRQEALVREIERIVQGPPAGAAAGGGGVAMPQTDEEARAAFEQGRDAFNGGDYEEALRQFEAAVGAPGLNPANMPELVWDLAITKAHLGDEDGAMTDAMTFGQYDATRQEQLIRNITQVIHGPAEAAGAEATAAE
jgi:acyl CoA:acetate/3-ketoacid CoA transferase alpha subunit